MDWLADFRAGLTALTNWREIDPAAVASMIAQNWFVQFATVVVLVWLTLKIIARVYSGDVQNTPLGPIALGIHEGEPDDKTQRICVPKVTLPQSMNGQHAYCTFVYSYIDSEGERHYIDIKPPKKRTKKALSRRRFLFEIRDRRFSREGTEALGNEIIDGVASRDVWLHNPDASPSATLGPATPDSVSDWMKAQPARDLRTSATEIVTIPDGLRDHIMAERETFIKELADKVSARRNKILPLRLLDRHKAEMRPGVMGTYFLKVSFDTSTSFVLFQHPDRDLKMTAWLTVLTTLFGFLIGKFP